MSPRRSVTGALATINEVTACQPWIMHHVLDDGDDYFVGTRWPNGSTVTAIVYVDTNLGWIVKDAFAVRNRCRVWCANTGLL